MGSYYSMHLTGVISVVVARAQANMEDKGFYIRSGIVTVLRNAEIPDGTVL